MLVATQNEYTIIIIIIILYSLLRQMQAAHKNTNTNSWNTKRQYKSKKHRIAHTELPHNHEKAEFSSTWLTVVITEWCSTRHRYRWQRVKNGNIGVLWLSTNAELARLLYCRRRAVSTKRRRWATSTKFQTLVFGLNTGLRPRPNQHKI